MEPAARGAVNEDQSLKLDAVVQNVRSHLYMERYVDNGAMTYSPFAARNEAAPCYWLESRQPCFDLVAVNAPTNRVSMFQAEPSRRLFEPDVRPQGVLFRVHPETSVMRITTADEHLQQRRR
jgi:hypothetical protein